MGQEIRLPRPSSSMGRDQEALSMRKVILGVGLSVDGYFARPDGAVEFPFHAEGLLDGCLLGLHRYLCYGPQDSRCALPMGGGSGSFGGRPAYVR